MVRRLVLAFAMLAASSTALAADAPLFGALSLENLEGRKVSLQQLRGKVVLLNFWATWCLPCVAEMPVLADLARKYGERGFVVVAASVDEPGNEDAIGRFAGRLPEAMQVWVGATQDDMARLQVGSSLPVSVLIDREGRAVGARQGAVGPGALDGDIESALGKETKKTRPAAGLEQAKGPSGAPACVGVRTPA